MITISLCMIVKNEEKVLRRCLDSVHDLVDEIIIVDTGSTDKTKEIAKAYTDKIYDFTWIGDFAAARNFSFSKCSMDYIYHADADEVLDEENRGRFKILKQTLLPEIEIVQMKYANQLQFSTIYNFDEEYRPKLYKRLREFVWEHPIHEAVRLEPVIYDSDVVITHLPEELHTGRDLAAFRRIIEGGQRLDKRLHNLYAKELFVSGSEQDFIKAKEFFANSCEDISRDSDEQMEAFCVAAKGYRLCGDIPNFFKYALKAIASNGCAEICYELGDYYRSIDDMAEAQMWFYNAAHETESILNIKYGEEYPLKALEEIENISKNKEN